MKYSDSFLLFIMIPAKNKQFYQFCAYGFLKNLRFFDPFLLLFFLSKGFSYIDIGLLYAVREIGFVLTEIPSGIFADAFGRKKSLIFSYIAYLVSFLAFYLSDSFLPVAFAMLLFSLGESFRSGTHKAMIFSYLEHNNWTKYKTDYYGNTRACSQMGSAVSAALAAIIVILSPKLELIFLFSIIPYLFGLINLALYPKYIDKINKQQSIKDLLKESLKLTRLSWQLFKQKKMILAVINLSFYTSYYKSVKDYFQILIISFGSGLIVIEKFNLDQQNAFLIGIAYTLLYFLTSLASRKSQRFQNIFKSETKALNLSIFFGILIGAISGLFLWIDLKLLAIILFFSVYIIENLRKPIGISHVIDYSNEKINATVLSVSSQMEALIAAIIAVYIGFVAEHYSVGLALFSASLVLLLFWPVYWLKDRAKQHG
jgi:MFS family permease